MRFQNLVSVVALDLLGEAYAFRDGVLVFV